MSRPAPELVHRALRKTLAELRTPASTILKKCNASPAPRWRHTVYKFSFVIGKLGEQSGVPLTEVLTEAIGQTKIALVPIVNEAQYALATDYGARMILALKAAADMLPTERVLCTATGSHHDIAIRYGRRRRFDELFFHRFV